MTNEITTKQIQLHKEIIIEILNKRRKSLILKSFDPISCFTV